MCVMCTYALWMFRLLSTPSVIKCRRRPEVPYMASNRSSSTVEAEEQEEPRALYIIGVLFTLISIFLSTTAFLIQKYAAHREKGKPVWKRWRLVCAVSLNLFSEVTFSTLGVYFAPLVLVAPLSGLGLIINAVLTHFGLICGIRERMSRWGWFATLSATFGVALVAMSGAGNASASTRVWVADMPAILTRPQSLAITALLAGSVFVWTLVDKVEPLKCLRPRSVAVRSFLSGLAAASSGGLSISILKFTVNAFAEVSEGLWPPPCILYILLALLVMIAPLQLWLLNDALAASQAVLIIPLYMSGMTVLVTVLGGVMLDEFASMGIRDVVLFGSGNVCVFVGIYALALVQRPHSTAGVRTAPPLGPAILSLEDACLPGSPRDVTPSVSSTDPDDLFQPATPTTTTSEVSSRYMTPSWVLAPKTLPLPFTV